MKKLLALLLAAAMTMSFAACGSSSSSEEGAAAEGGQEASGETADSGEEITFIVRETGDPKSFNPDIMADDNAYVAVQNMFNRLVKLDASKQVIPDAAETWEFSEDGLTLTFHLRQDLTWSDGEKLTSEDVKYTFDTIKANPTYHMNSYLTDVTSIEAPDDYTVVFNLAQPDVSIVANLGWYACFILPEHVYNNGQSWDENPASMNPVTSGPFKFESYTQGERTVLVANEDYYNPPKIDRLILSIIPDEATAVQALINGELDYYTTIPTANVAELEADPNISLALNEYPSPYRFIFNTKDEIMQDEAVRRAFAHCINREEISEKVYNNVMPPEYNFYPSMIEWASNSEDTVPKFDLEATEKCLIDAGYTKNANGYYIEGVTIDAFEAASCPDLAKLVVANLDKVGIKAEVIVSEYNAWNDKVGIQRDFCVELQGGFMGPDPNALYMRFGTGTASNYGDWSNAEFDAICAEARATSDQAARGELYKQAQKIMSEELPYVPVVAFGAYDAYSARFKNLPNDGAGKWGWNEFTYTELA